MTNQSDYYEGSVRRFQSNPSSIEHVDTLALRAKAGSAKARDELVEALAGIAEVASSKHLKLAQFRGLERDDLRQEAMCAMLKGLEMWDPQKATFRTYAFDRARFAVLDAVNSAHLVTVPRNYASAATSDSPSNDFTRLAPETRSAARRAVGPVSELKPPTDEEPGCDPGEIEEGYEEAITHLAVEQILGRGVLSAREKKVLVTKYGLFGTEKKTEREIGEEFGVCTQRIQNIKQRALEKISVSNSTRATRRMASGTTDKALRSRTAQPRGSGGSSVERRPRAYAGPSR